HASGRSQSNDCPIVSGPATPLCFPSVTHVGGASRHDQVVTMTEEHVAARQNAATILNGRQVGITADLPQWIPGRHNFTVNAQARYAAIGINLEAQMRPTLIAGN